MVGCLKNSRSCDISNDGFREVVSPQLEPVKQSGIFFGNKSETNLEQMARSVKFVAEITAS